MAIRRESLQSKPSTRSRRRRADRLARNEAEALTASDPALTQPLQTPDQLHAWIVRYCGIDIPRQAVCAGHNAPFDFVQFAYFEPSRDLIVWAPRGGGKTRLAAVVSLLDLLHKPGSAVRIIGGSLEQSMRLWDHLHPDLIKLAERLIQGKPRARAIALQNGSDVAAIAQSQRAVRGLRVQKLRCDEVEMFDPKIWEALQLATRSKPGVRGSIDAISTMHTPWGLMHKIVEEARGSGKTIVRWCLLDVLERCREDRSCQGCELWNDCLGVAKHKCNGFVSIDDAIAMKRRVSTETWEAEMLCKRPSVRGAVFPTFDEETHVREFEPADGSRFHLAVDFGFSNPFVCLWIESKTDGTVRVIDEYVQSGRVMSEHIAMIRSRPWPVARDISCDPAGASRNDQTAESNIQLLRKAGFVVRTRHSNIVDGLEHIRVGLRPATGLPRLFVHRRCKHLIRALRCYRYPDKGGELPFKDQTHDHLIDALRYFFVNRVEHTVKSIGY